MAPLSKMWRDSKRYPSGSSSMELIQSNLEALQQQLSDYQRETVNRVNAVELQLLADIPTIDEEGGTARPTTASRRGSVRRTCSAGNTSDVQMEFIQLRKEMDSIKSEMINEMRATRYDMMKELTVIQGGMQKLFEFFTYNDEGVEDDEDDDLEPHLPHRKPSNSVNSLSYGSSETVESHQELTSHHYIPTPPVRLSRKILEDDPIMEGHNIRNTIPSTINAINLMGEDTLNKLLRPFPMKEEEMIKNASRRCPGTREWCFDSFEHWVRSSETKNDNERLIVLSGQSGTGKTTVFSELCHRFEEVLAYHFCVFDESMSVNPSRVFCSLAYQIAMKLKDFQIELSKVNIEYIVDRQDASTIFRRFLIEPLSRILPPSERKVIMIDGLDQCEHHSGSELLHVFSSYCMELPSWILLFVTAKSSNKVSKDLPLHLKWSLNQDNPKCEKDMSLYIEKEILGKKLLKENVAKAIKKIQRKANGNFLYLYFIQEALQHSGVENKEGQIDLETIEELPSGLHGIYEDIFEEKFGKAQGRSWKKALPLFELIAASHWVGKYPLSERFAREVLEFTKDDLKKIHRQFLQIIDIQDGRYRPFHLSLFEWLTSPKRSTQPFFVSAQKGIQKIVEFKANMKHRSVKTSATSIVHFDINIIQ